MRLREALNDFAICKIFVNGEKVEYKEELLDEEGIIGILTDGNCNSYFIFAITDGESE